MLVLGLVCSAFVPAILAPIHPLTQKPEVEEQRPTPDQQPQSRRPEGPDDRRLDAHEYKGAPPDRTEQNQLKEAS